MKIYVRVKAIGKRRDVLPLTSYIVPDGIASLRQLLTAVVENEVARYNAHEPGRGMTAFWTESEIEDRAQSGKVGFGTIYADKKADRDKAVANVMQCFEDGLIRVFMGDEELTEPDAPLTVLNGAVFTFIRLTFLAGGLW